MKQKIEDSSKLEKRRYYVAYGSNMPSREMLSRCPSAKLVGKTWLVGWKLRFNQHADIFEEQGAQTPAVIWEISGSDEKNLDVYEGFPYYYEKVNVTVNTDRGTILAIAYTMTAEHKVAETVPEKSYLDTIRAGYAEHGFTEEIEVLV